jgi:endogenous inhibitor of DNA gyrase (YacG/DUF329 family)
MVPRMPRKRSLKLRCPICKKAVNSTDPESPFCSSRCRLIDLGKWASGGYVITSPVQDVEELIQDRAPEDSGSKDPTEDS